MQYTFKLAILAVALFSTSALAVPFASFESELEVRETDNKLSAREFFDAYLEARENPSLDARELEALDLEAREYFEYLEMREVASTSTADHSATNSPAHSGSSDSHTPPQTPLSTTSQQGDEQHPHFALLQEHRASATKAANEKFKDLSFYNKALANEDSRYHRLAVAKYLNDPSNLKEALANKQSHFHKAAQRMVHKQNAKVYLEDAKQYKKALKSKHNKYHKDAVKQYLSDPEAFEHALSSKHAHFHKEALHQYLLDSTVRKGAIADEKSPYHKAAVKLEKKLDAKKHGKKHSSSPTATSTTATETPSATHAT
jgi:hypothetical protein